MCVISFLAGELSVKEDGQTGIDEDHCVHQKYFEGNFLKDALRFYSGETMEFMPQSYLSHTEWMKKVRMACVIFGNKCPWLRVLLL